MSTIVRLKQNKATLFILALVMFASGVFLAYHPMLVRKKQPLHKEVDHTVASKHQPGRMLVILVDGLRNDFAFSNRMPFLSSCRIRGVWGVSEVVSLPLSIAGDQAIFSGTVADPLAILQDFQASTATSDNLFFRVTRTGSRAVIFGDLLRGAYGEYTDLTAFKPKSFLFSEYRENAAHIFEQAYSFLKTERWNLAVIQFITLDYLGHLGTPLSSNYPSTLLLIDEYIRMLVSLTTDNDTVLITSEHGMDDYGFHMDRSPEVVETPFILSGPEVKKGGPKTILQIDWAPTLSILAGVSPFYNSPALPALDLIKIPENEASVLLKKFSEIIAGTSTALALNELRERRLAILAEEASPVISGLIALVTFLSMTIFAYIALRDSVQGWKLRSTLFGIGGGVFGLCLLISFLLWSGVLDYLSCHLTFSANFILTHPFGVITAFVLIAFLPLLYKLVFDNKGLKFGKTPLLFLFAFAFSSVFLCTNPYHPLNWIVLSLPLVGFAVLHRFAWLVIFGGICIGFVIRRLTFYNVYDPIDLPARWLLAVAMLIAALAYLCWRMQNEPRKTRVVWTGVLCFFPGILVIAWRTSVEMHAMFLLILMIPVIFASLKEPKARDIWWALWVVFFYLGTSSSINNTAHIVALPLLIAAWKASEGTSAVARGVVVTLVVWALYLIPGNSFDLKIIELNDRFILTSAIDQHIEITVMLIAVRYILPIAVLIWGMKWTQQPISMLSMASTALLPVVCGIGAMLTVLSLSHAVIGLPWERFIRLAVLLGYFTVLICALTLVAAAMQIYGFFLTRRLGT